MSDARLSRLLLWGGVAGFCSGLVVKKSGRLLLYGLGTYVIGAAVHNILTASKTRTPLSPESQPPVQPPPFDDALYDAFGSASLADQFTSLSSNEDVSAFLHAVCGRATPATFTFLIGLGIGLARG